MTIGWTLRLFAALYLTAGLGSILRHGTWRDGIAGFLEGPGGKRAARDLVFWLGVVVGFVIGIVGDVLLWPVNEWTLRRHE